MTAVAAFVAAAALGAVMRWQAGRLLPSVWGTFVVNVAGAFALGALSGVGHTAAAVIGVGGLGGLTTFSTLAAELRDLASRHPVKAAAYLTATLTAGLGAAAAGIRLAL